MAETVGFATQVMDLLDTHHAELDGALRRTMVGSLILLRNRNQLEPLAVLPLFFRLFRCQDKQLRHMLFKHIVTGEAGRDQRLRCWKALG